MGYGLLNLGSLLFGITALIFPVAGLIRHKNLAVFTAASISACAISLYMQVLYCNHLVSLKDWSALMDTSDAVALAASALIAAVAILNLIQFLAGRGRA